MIQILLYLCNGNYDVPFADFLNFKLAECLDVTGYIYEITELKPENVYRDLAISTSRQHGARAWHVTKAYGERWKLSTHLGSSLLTECN